MSKRKTLCDWSKDKIKKDLPKLEQIVTPPNFACRKCARVATQAIHLCKPIPLPRENRYGQAG